MAKRPFSVGGYSYCLVKQIVEDALAISVGDLGTLEEAYSIASCSNVDPSKIIKEGDTTLFTATTDIGASLKTSNLVSDVKDILDDTHTHHTHTHTHTHHGTRKIYIHRKDTHTHSVVLIFFFVSPSFKF